MSWCCCCYRPSQRDHDKQQQYEVRKLVWKCDSITSVISHVVEWRFERLLSSMGFDVSAGGKLTALTRCYSCPIQNFTTVLNAKLLQRFHPSSCIHTWNQFARMLSIVDDNGKHEKKTSEVSQNLKENASTTYYPHRFLVLLCHVNMNLLGAQWPSQFAHTLVGICLDYDSEDKTKTWAGLNYTDMLCLSIRLCCTILDIMLRRWLIHTDEAQFVIIDHWLNNRPFISLLYLWHTRQSS